MSEKKMNDEFYDNLYMAIRDGIYEALKRTIKENDIEIIKNGWTMKLKITQKKSPN